MRVSLILFFISSISLSVAQNKVAYTIRCLEKNDSLSRPSAERKIELNKQRKMLSSSYITASDDRKRNTIRVTYDKKGRVKEKEEYSWSNYFLEIYSYEKDKEIQELKFNTTNSTHIKYFNKGKVIEEKVFSGMKTFDDSLRLSYTVKYLYDAADSLTQLLYYRPKDTTWFEKIDRKFEKNKLIRIEHFSREQQLDYRELKYDSSGQLVEEGFWDIKHPSNWEQLKYTYYKNSKEVLRSNIYIEEWTLFEKGEIRRRKIYDITTEGVLLRQFEEYLY